MPQTVYNFRTLNYLGSKLRLLDFIEGNVCRVTPDGGVCDLFAGSGCVSYRLSQRFTVVACDIQDYSRVICNALLTPCDITTDEATRFVKTVKGKMAKLEEAFYPLIAIENEAIANKDLNVLTDVVEHGSLESFRMTSERSSVSDAQWQVLKNLEKSDMMNKLSLISRYYGGVYFSYLQAVQIDVIREVIRSIGNVSKQELCLAALLSTASEAVDTVGKHFAQPIKARDSKGNIKNLVYNKAVSDKTIELISCYEEWLQKYVSLPKSDRVCQVLKGDFKDCLQRLPENVSTIYADPPYTRDHYSRFYHVLETLALDDEPEISTVKIHGVSHISNGIYRKNRYQSPFCIKSQAQEAFKSMFRTISETGRNLLLSYSPYDETKITHPRVVTMKLLLELAHDFFTKVEVVSAGHFTHSKLNSTEHFLSSSKEAEMLIICTN